MKTILCLSAFFLNSLFAYSQTTILVDFNHPGISKEMPPSSSYPSGYDFEVSSVSYGVANTVSWGPSGPAPTKPTFSSINFLHSISRNSPVFNYMTASGTNIPKVTIGYFTSTGSPSLQLTYRITLEDVIVSSVATASDKNCNCIGNETVSIDFARIKMEDVASGVSHGWDIVKNTAW